MCFKKQNAGGGVEGGGEMYWDSPEKQTKIIQRGQRKGKKTHQLQLASIKLIRFSTWDPEGGRGGKGGVLNSE